MRLAIAVLLLFAARPSHACSKRHQTPFELFDEAATVAVVKVRYVPPGKNGLGPAGDVELGVVASFKGSPGKTIIAQETNTSCAVGFRAGLTALVFLKPSGFPAGAFEGYIPDDNNRERELAPWRDAIDKFASATDRGAVLVELIAGGNPDVAREAAYYLVDSPALLVGLDRAQRDKLAAATPPKQSMLPEVLERVNATRFESITDPAVLADKIASGTDNAERIAAMERCERVRKQRLAWYSRYHAGRQTDAGWARFADACRTGTPLD
jgi:hypothetical protein